MSTSTLVTASPDDAERKLLLRRLYINMLMLLGKKSKTEVSEWIRTWLENWRPSE